MALLPFHRSTRRSGVIDAMQARASPLGFARAWLATGTVLMALLVLLGEALMR